MEKGEKETLTILKDIINNPHFAIGDVLFRDVPGYEELYAVSTEGRVLSKKFIFYLTPHQSKSNKIWSVKLSKDGKSKTFSCGRIVALAWVENPNPKMYKYAIHKDGNINDYSFTNMVWGTSLHSVEKKWQRHPELKDKFKPKVYKSPTQKMTPEMVDKLMEYRKQGYSARQLADIFPIKKSQVMNIIKQHS